MVFGGKGPAVGRALLGNSLRYRRAHRHQVQSRRCAKYSKRQGCTSPEAARRAEERGRIQIEVNANSTLHKDNEELEALQLGAVQMLAPSLVKFASLGIKEFEIFDLPFLFHDTAAVQRAQRGALGPLLMTALEAKGIGGLAFWGNGLKVMSANRPLRLPEDFRGLNFSELATPNPIVTAASRNDPIGPADPQFSSTPMHVANSRNDVDLDQLRLIRVFGVLTGERSQLAEISVDGRLAYYAVGARIGNAFGIRGNKHFL